MLDIHYKACQDFLNEEAIDKNRKKKRNLIMIFLIIVIFTGLSFAGYKTYKIKYNVKEDQFFGNFNSLYLLYAISDESGYLPLKMFSEKDSLFVQYIRNGKSLDKIPLVYSHLKKNEYEDTLYCLDEIVNGEKKGCYQIPKKIFDTISCLFQTIPTVDLIYKNKEKSIKYSIAWSLSKEQGSIVVADDDYENDLYSYVKYEKPILDFLYSIYSNPQSIDKFSFDEIDNDNFWTSKDGNLRIYYQCFAQGGNGYGSDYPLEIVQFRDGNSISAFGEIDWGYEQLHLKKFVYTANIKIYTVSLNNKIYYLIDRAMFDGWPLPYSEIKGEKTGKIEIGEMFYGNGDVLQIYAIENGELIKKELFNTTKNVIDNLAIEYDGSQECSNLFKYDQQSKTIYVPLVEGIKLTNKYLVYQWDGKYFTYKGIK
jgi:hypothetical protein